jgi:hypothetical protein
MARLREGPCPPLTERPGHAARSRRRLLPRLSLLTATASWTQDVTFGGPTTVTNSFPVAACEFQFPNRYQQLYTASNFAVPVFIDAIRLSDTRSVAAGLPASLANGDYLIRPGSPTGPRTGLARTSTPTSAASRALRRRQLPNRRAAHHRHALPLRPVARQPAPRREHAVAGDPHGPRIRLILQPHRRHEPGVSPSPFPFTGPFPVVADAGGLVHLRDARRRTRSSAPRPIARSATGFRPARAPSPRSPAHHT